MAAFIEHIKGLQSGVTKESRADYKAIHHWAVFNSGETHQVPFCWPGGQTGYTYLYVYIIYIYKHICHLAWRHMKMLAMKVEQEWRRSWTINLAKDMVGLFIRACTFSSKNWHLQHYGITVEPIVTKRVAGQNQSQCHRLPPMPRWRLQVVYDRNKIFLIFSAEVVDIRPWRSGWYSTTTDSLPKWPIFGQNGQYSAERGLYQPKWDCVSWNRTISVE